MASRHLKVDRLVRDLTVTGEGIPLTIEQQCPMGHIATTYDFYKNLTIFKVVGKMRSADFIDCFVNYDKRRFVVVTTKPGNGSELEVL